MTLNCNPINGELITDQSAMINFYGRTDSISGIYNSCRYNGSSPASPHEPFTHFVINGEKYPREMGEVFYDSLWWTFLNTNQELANKIRRYDAFNDGMPDAAMNSAARVFAVLKQYGLTGLHSKVKKFLAQLAAVQRMPSYKSIAQSYVKEWYGKKSKDEILDMIRNSYENKEKRCLIQLVDVYYDDKDGCISEAYKKESLARILGELGE